jgi:hypothetical protein
MPSVRKSPTDSATKYNIGVRKIGNDGNMWIIDETITGVKRWKKISSSSPITKRKRTISRSKNRFSVEQTTLSSDDTKYWTDVNKIKTKVYDKLFAWWRDLGEGHLMVIYKNGTYEMMKMTPFEKYDYSLFQRRWIEKGNDTKVNKILWSSTSTDNLDQFVSYILIKLPVQITHEILKAANNKNKIISIILKYQKKFIEMDKHSYISKKDYILRSFIDESFNDRKKIYKKFAHLL